MEPYHFPEQNILCPEAPYCAELLRDLLARAFDLSSPFTGYLRFTSDDAVYFLFFFNGAPYAAGRYAGGKPVSYTIRQLGEHLASSVGRAVSVCLCATDPVLLKSMLLFLQEEPAVKAPTALIDLEHIVRQIGEAGSPAMIALCRERKFNYFYFRDGVAALAHFGDSAFQRPEGMSVDEEMLLYSFQPGGAVEAYVFRDMVTAEAEDAGRLDREALLAVLSGSSGAAAAGEARPVADQPASGAPAPRPRAPRVDVTVESGPRAGERFTVSLPCTIGRKNCDLILDDGMVSRRHAELRIVERKLVIEDLGSTNGTRVNDEVVTLKRLVPNDRIHIGETVLRITPASS